MQIHRLSVALLLFFLPLGSWVQASEPCLMCHRDQSPQFSHQAGKVTCTACHGESKSHLSGPMNESPDHTFQESEGGDSCSACHQGEKARFWLGSLHETAGVTCSNCHSEHKKAADTEVTGTDLCLSCHQSLKSSLHLPARHPILEGQMSCSDCHEPHGTANDMLLKGVIPTDACTGCHAEYRGPFLFEHDPVTEDCTLCHKPHGSVQPGMLTTRTPFLCQQCHQAANHSSSIADGESLSRGSTNMLGRDCLSCHSRVHGSNHPSGLRLTR